MRVNLVYFAWVREKIGKGEEVIELPSQTISVGELISHLKTSAKNMKLLSSMRRSFARPSIRNMPNMTNSSKTAMK